MQQFSLWTQHLMQIAEQTYQVIAPLLGTQESRKKYQQGAGGDITTEIDKCAEDSILNELSKLGEPCIIISEESGETRLFCEDLDSTDIPYLIIDPVDGTTNAMRGIPFSCISLAYADGPNISDLKSGIIVNLFTHDLYVAEKDQGAWRNQDRIYCSLTTTLDEAVVGIDVNMKNAASDIHTLWEDVIQTGYKMRLLGSCALELCMVAQGSLDLYIDFRRFVRIVDMAAALVIVQEAGGEIMDDTGQSLEGSFSLDDRYNLVISCPAIAKILRPRLH